MLKLRISQKLLIFVAIAVLAFVISQGYSLVTERNNAARLADVKERLYPTLELTTVNLGTVLLMEQTINSAVTTGDSDSLSEAATQFRLINNNFDRLQQLGAANQVPETRKMLHNWYENAIAIAESFIDGSVDFSKVASRAKANAERLEALTHQLEQMKAQTEGNFTRSIADTLDDSANAVSIALGISLLTIIVLVVMSILISRSITRSLRQVSESLHEMASGEGDLTSRIHYQGRDEIRDLADNFNAFIAKLHQSFAEVLQDVTALSEVASRLTRTSDNNVTEIAAQAQAISATRNAIEELMDSVRQVAEFAGSASVQTGEINQTAEQGQATLNTNVNTITELAGDVKNSADVVNKFDSFSADVGQLLNTIQTVAEQTNLLALNAAIEAARAGEHGRGFAVVADEVRDLAVRTRQATEEIHTVINELQKVSKNAVSSMEASVVRANSGVDATRESEQALRDILSRVQEISAFNDQIAEATRQQSATFSEVMNHVKDIHQNTETVTDSTSAMNDICQDIDDISRRLGAVASQFKV